MAGQHLCGWRAHRWVLQAPRPSALCSLTPDPVPEIQPEAPVGMRFRGDADNSAPERREVGAKRRKVEPGAGPPECGVGKDSGVSLLLRLCGTSARNALPLAAPGSSRS